MGMMNSLTSQKNNDTSSMMQNLAGSLLGDSNPYIDDGSNILQDTLGTVVDSVKQNVLGTVVGNLPPSNTEGDSKLIQNAMGTVMNNTLGSAINGGISSPTSSWSKTKGTLSTFTQTTTIIKQSTSQSNKEDSLDSPNSNQSQPDSIPVSFANEIAIATSQEASKNAPLNRAGTNGTEAHSGERSQPSRTNELPRFDVIALLEGESASTERPEGTHVACADNTTASG
ncbi:hypothetical protein KIN20_014992 [Parelaphostrongylus tenuis]|uniref:Uncharacterized protein n=1 Tax=Parelaphostrongylus tenuis TaxID=148309 RepID=A0AAD5QPJ8_PARTN|nr:hypothetical protein KIN20_014992 [Parelaphostrongylus tenuis]